MESSQAFRSRLIERNPEIAPIRIDYYPTQGNEINRETAQSIQRAVVLDNTLQQDLAMLAYPQSEQGESLMINIFYQGGLQSLEEFDSLTEFPVGSMSYAFRHYGANHLSGYRDWDEEAFSTTLRGFPRHWLLSLQMQPHLFRLFFACNGANLETIFVYVAFFLFFLDSLLHTFGKSSGKSLPTTFYLVFRLIFQINSFLPEPGEGLPTLV